MFLLAGVFFFSFKKKKKKSVAFYRNAAAEDGSALFRFLVLFETVWPKVRPPPKGQANPRMWLLLSSEKKVTSAPIHLETKSTHTAVLLILPLSPSPEGTFKKVKLKS